MNLKKIVLGSSILVSTLFAGSYNVDGAHSAVGFKVKHMMITNVAGEFDKFTGTFEYDEKKNTLTALSGTVEVSSVNTGIAKRDGHLKSADFFDVAKYPTMTFKVTKIDGEDVYGDLTLRGVTKNIKLELENGGTGKDPWGNFKAGFALEGKISRADFGLTYNKAIETGGVLIGDTVKINIDIAGVKTK